MSSDYLLGLLGVTPDNSHKRLGDGLYEQRLIREAVVARTGQRFLDGLTSDEAMFRYLMDNAIASKQALNLSLGVTLSAAQVAALTHDLVWLEEALVNGEKVLVPVLYLAQAKNRLAPNGALIQGKDVTLLAGNELNNAGTLRAANNLSASATNISNSGLMEAGQRLELLASDSIRNTQGGIISGRDVRLTALTGDVLNERTVTQHAGASGRTWTQSFADSAARIEASNRLDISAGRDIANLGGVMQSRGNLSLDAGRDVTIASVEQRNSESRGSRYNREQITQLGAEVAAGRDLTTTTSPTASGSLSINAGRDLTVIASKLDARRDLDLIAGRDVTLAAAANEEHFYSKSKKVTRQEDHVQQQSTEVNAGGDVFISAGQDLTLLASKVEAGNEAYLVAGNNLALLSAEDSDYSLYDMKKKGSWGSKKTQRDETTSVTHVGSEIKTGGDLTLVSGGDQLYQGARLDSGNDLTLDSGGGITFEAVKDSHQESHDKSSNSWVWTSMDSKGKVDETVRQSQLTAKGQVLINAVDGLHIDVKQVNQQTVSQSIDAMVQADPSMAWLKDVEARGDVDWRQVKELHDKWHDSHSGLGGPAMIVIIIIVTYFTAGAASGALGTAAGATAGSTSAMAAGTAATATSAATTAGWANAALSAVAASAASTATVSTINNKGDVGAALKETFSSDNLKNYIVGGATAGLTAGLFNDWTGTQTGGGTALTDSTSGALANSGKVVASNPGGLSSLQGVGQFAANQALQNTTSAVLNKALGREGSLGDALQTSLANTFAAVGFNLVGDIGKINNLQEGGLTKIGLHAVMGGLAAEAAGGDFKTGALAAGVNEALVDVLAKQYADMPKEDRDRLLVMNSQLIGVLTTAIQDPDADAEKLQTGSWVAQNATQYNHILHEPAAKKVAAEALEHCQKNPQQCDVGVDFAGLTVDDIVDAMRVEGAHGDGIDTIKPEAIAFVDGFMFSKVPQLRDVLYSPTESEASRLDIEQKASMLMAVVSFGQAARNVGNLTQGFAGAGASAAELVKSGQGIGAKGAGEVASIGGKTCVYNCVVDGVTRYVGITDDIVKRGQAHLRQKGIVVSKIRGLDNISRADARAVEQTLIDYHGLGKDGGTLINKINSISSVKNPTKYEQGLIRGAELLKKAGYEGF